jgi:hypothetical protein
MKRVMLINFILMLILVSSVVVYAAGSSTTSRVTSVNESVNDKKYENESDETVPETEDGRKIRDVQKARVKFARARQHGIDVSECEEFDNRTERIKCRLRIARESKVAGETSDDGDYDDQYGDRIPEACLRLKDAAEENDKHLTKDHCKRLYRNVNKCYELPGRAKDQCFKRIIGFARAHINDEDDDKPRKSRQYVVVLLYELQERIEHVNEEGKISDEDSAEIIDLIVEIKEDILNGEGKEVVKPKLKELRVKIKAVRPSGEDGEDANETEEVEA